MPLNWKVDEDSLLVSTALTVWPRKDPVTAPNVWLLFDCKLRPESVSATSTVNGTPSKVPVMWRKGKVDESGVPELGVCAVPVAAMGRPWAEPLTELRLGLIPLFPTQVTVAVPFPRGSVVRRAISARTGTAASSRPAAASPPTAATRTPRRAIRSSPPDLWTR